MDEVKSVTIPGELAYGESLHSSFTRNLKVKRIYSLGQYQNIEFTDEVVGIPEELATKEEVISSISRVQLIRLETLYTKYLLLREKVREAQPEDIIGYLEDLHAEETAKLYDLITKKE